MDIGSGLLTSGQDREAEPRFGPPGGVARGGFGGGMGGAYGAAGGFNAGMPGAAGGGGGGGRQIYVSNVRSVFSHLAPRQPGACADQTAIAALYRGLARPEGSLPTGR